MSLNHCRRVAHLLAEYVDVRAATNTASCPNAEPAVPRFRRLCARLIFVGLVKNPQGVVVCCGPVFPHPEVARHHQLHGCLFLGFKKSIYTPACTSALEMLAESSQTDLSSSSL